MAKVKCIYCGSKMDKTSDVDYECPKCGAEAWADTEDGEIEFGDEPVDGIEYDDIFDKPLCCRTCGGNYPDCMDSCEIFDD